MGYRVLSLRSIPAVFINGCYEDTFKGGGGGGGGFMPIILETLVLIYELKGKARTRPEIFRVVVCPCEQFYPREAAIGSQMFGDLNQKYESISFSGI